MARNAPLVVSMILFQALAAFLSTQFGSDPALYEIDQPGNNAICTGDMRFAIIGDYGSAGPAEQDVAGLVHGWKPDFIVTAGDNNYPDGLQSTIDDNIGQYYSNYIYPYTGSYGSTATENRFFPALGNHDWRAASSSNGYFPKPFLDYFTLPGNKRYYDVPKGLVHLFIIDSDSEEPDGNNADSIQAGWLAAAMAASSARWKIVVLHHAPYSSGKHGSLPVLQWDYAAMGATAVIAGHDHLYERIMRDGIVYFVNGLGGYPGIYNFGTPIDGSAARYNQDHGAMLVTAGDDCLNFSFYSRASDLIDSHTVGPTVFSFLPVVVSPSP